MKFLGQKKIKIYKREQLELALKKEKILRTLITIDNGNGNDRSKINLALLSKARNNSRN